MGFSIDESHQLVSLSLKPMDSRWANEPGEESKLAEENYTFLWECTVIILYPINLSGEDNASVFSLKQNLNILGLLLIHFLAER